MIETDPPLPNSYWVYPGQLLAGEYPGAPRVATVRKRIQTFLTAGIDFFVDLTMPDELPPYAPELPAHVRHVRVPIFDHDIPMKPEEMVEILRTIKGALDANRRVYVHCRAGIGRTGTVIGCLLADRGISGDEALYELNRLWQQCARSRNWKAVPETNEQIEYVRRWDWQRYPATLESADGQLAAEMGDGARRGTDTGIDSAAGSGAARARRMNAGVGTSAGKDAHLGTGAGGTRSGAGALSGTGGGVSTRSGTGALSGTGGGAGTRSGAGALAGKGGDAGTRSGAGSLASTGGSAGAGSLAGTGGGVGTRSGSGTLAGAGGGVGARSGAGAPANAGSRPGQGALAGSGTDMRAASGASSGARAGIGPQAHTGAGGVRSGAGTEDVRMGFGTGGAGAVTGARMRTGIPVGSAAKATGSGVAPADLPSMWTAQPAVDPSVAFGSGRAILDPPLQEEALSTAYIPTPGVAQLPARSIRERYLGALIGLAVGDALGATHQQQTPGSFEPISDLTGGGVLNLPRGAWTDDTAMALCLAESLLESRGFDARDQVERYARWQQNGYMSATGEAVGITPNTARSIAMAQWRRQLFAGSHDPKLVEPTPLSRMAPAVMFYLPFRDQALEFAGDAVRTTCQAPLVLNVCRLFAAMVHAALEGQPKPQVLAPPWDLPADRPKSRIRGLIEGRYRAKDPAVIHAGDHILDTLELVLWAFERTDSFLEGALLVANAGESSDVAGAVYGQLAGAYYGVDAIPPSWRNSLIGKDLIESLALRLLEQTKVGQIK